jgi:Ni,Fe-hydrogenase III small subunit
MWRDLIAGRLRRSTTFGAPDTASPPDLEVASVLTARLDGAAQARLGRSLALLQVGTGGCDGCAQEVRALRGVAYDLERHGLSFVASPRHADVLLVTGPLTHAMRVPMMGVWAAMPAPKWVVAIGACAIDGGVFGGSYAVQGGIDGTLPVDIIVPGCPPSPAAVLTALLTVIEANV